MRRVDTPKHSVPAKRGLFSGIVARLRLLLLAVGAVTVAACFAGFTQLREISSAHLTLTNGALPTLIQAQSVERELNDIVRALDRSDQTERPGTAAEIERDLITRIDAFRTQLATVLQMQGGDISATQLKTEVDRLRTSVENSFDRRQRLSLAEQRIADLQRDLNRVSTELRGVLLSFREETAQQIESRILKAHPSDSIGSGHTYGPVSDLFAASRVPDRLAGDVDTIAGLVRIAESVGSSQEFTETRRGLDAAFNRAAGTLSTLDPGLQSTELTDLFSQLNDLTFGDRGLIAMADAQIALRNEHLAEQQTQRAIVTALSLGIDDLMSNAREAVAERSLGLDAATRSLSISLIICLFLAASITLIGNTIILEQQINRRMGRLNETVSAIADGNIDHPINIDGPDELGDIARALHVFKQNAEELRRSNIDLERFAYVAAHDLRAPLRAVQDLTEWTLEDEENVLSEESRSYLSMMQNRTQRLDRLLIDLLDYARAGQEQQGLVDVDLEQLVEQVTQLLAPPPGFAVKFTGPVLTVRTYRTPLRQILINLISNAIKHHDRARGHITISASLENDRLAIQVTDDGPGIPVPYQDRIYELFQTLKPRDEVEGSGLGLAIIRKILDRYRCDLMLDSNPDLGRGATFSFDFPTEQSLGALTHPHADAA